MVAWHELRAVLARLRGQDPCPLRGYPDPGAEPTQVGRPPFEISLQVWATDAAADLNDARSPPAAVIPPLRRRTAATDRRPCGITAPGAPEQPNIAAAGDHAPTQTPDRRHRPETLRQYGALGVPERCNTAIDCPGVIFGQFIP